MGDDGAQVQLDEVEQRVIGSLLEKERTVPASYPMTLNGLRTACNQASSRDPVSELDDGAILGAVDRLKARGLARMVHASHGSRTVKYRQVLDERLDLSPAERAVLTVLLLRGPSSPGELKSRTERLHAFRDRSGVDACLDALATREAALVRELARRPGQQDNRWVHLLGPVAETDGGGRAGASSSTPGVVTEVVLDDGPGGRDAKVVAAYDTVAGTYAQRLVDELDHKPFDRWLLERVAALADGGPVADAGCGPGHVTLHLAAAGADVTGFDLSPAMVAEASRRFGELRFEVADLTALPAPDRFAGPGGPGGPDGWAAICAWYSLVHLAASELRPAVALLAAALRPGGWLAFALHLGDEAWHLTDLWGHEVDVTFTLQHADRVHDAVRTAGLVDVEWYRRGPHPDPAVEVATERMYVLARRPS